MELNLGPGMRDFHPCHCVTNSILTLQVSFIFRNLEYKDLIYTDSLNVILGITLPISVQLKMPFTPAPFLKLIAAFADSSAKATPN